MKRMGTILLVPFFNKGSWNSYMSGKKQLYSKDNAGIPVITLTVLLGSY